MDEYYSLKSLETLDSVVVLFHKLKERDLPKKKLEEREIDWFDWENRKHDKYSLDLTTHNLKVAIASAFHCAMRQVILKLGASISLKEFDGNHLKRNCGLFSQDRR